MKREYLVRIYFPNQIQQVVAFDVTNTRELLNEVAKNYQKAIQVKILDVKVI